MEATRDIVIRTEQKVDDLKSLLTQHLTTDCNTQKELTDHKSNHKYWVMVVIGVGGLLITLSKVV